MFIDPVYKYTFFAVTCETPTDGTNTCLVSPGTKYLKDDTYTYSCKEGYEESTGDMQITCQNDGLWSGVTPACKSMFNIFLCLIPSS